MSELDVDIRAVSSASYGARNTVPDASQASTDDQSVLTSQADTSQSTQAAASSTTGAAVSSGGTAAQPSFRYDSFRFIYRSDYGRIVLVDQNPETGKPISQIPSQRALQIYAEQERTEGQPTPAATTGASGQVAGSSGRRTAVTPTTPTNSGGKTPTSSVVSAAISTAPAPTPTVPTAPSTPSPAFLVPSFSPVNITI